MLNYQLSKKLKLLKIYIFNHLTAIILTISSLINYINSHPGRGEKTCHRGRFWFIFKFKGHVHHSHKWNI